MILVFQHDGKAIFTGTWTGITAAKSFDTLLLAPPKGENVYYAGYSTGGTHSLVVGEKLTGGTSTNTCQLVAQIVENGTAGSGDSGWLFVTNLSGNFQAETLTGTATGTAVIYQNFIPLPQLSTPRAALITVRTAGIQFACDGALAGTAAASNIGHYMGDGESYVVRGAESVKRFSAINDVNANGAVLKYTIYF